MVVRFEMVVDIDCVPLRHASLHFFDRVPKICFVSEMLHSYWWLSVSAAAALLGGALTCQLCHPSRPLSQRQTVHLLHAFCAMYVVRGCLSRQAVKLAIREELLLLLLPSCLTF